LLVALAAYATFVIYGSLVPLQYEPLPLAEAIARFRAIPWLQLGVGQRADWVANLLLFVPLAFLTSGVVAGRLRGWRGLIAILLVVATCGALSVAIEFAQLWFPQRTVSQNDIAAEALGAAIGAALWAAIGPATIEWLDARSHTGATASRFDTVLWLYAVGLVIYSVMPLDLTISISELYDKFREGRINPAPFRHALPLTWHSAYELLRDVALFIPIGTLAFRRWPATSPSRCLGGVLAGIGVVAGIEAAQTLVVSRFADATDVVTGALGVVAGVALARRWGAAAGIVPPLPGRELQPPGSRRRAAGLAILAVGYSAILFAAAWYPFEFDFDPEFVKPRIQSFVTVPLTTLYLSPEFAALTNALSHMAWFAPLGVLADWAARLGATTTAARRALLTLNLLLVLAAAGAMEAGQIAIPAHTASIDGVILRAVGAVLGLLLSRFLAPAGSSAASRPVKAG
jgi:glycopeptide antibiotics resistance protein